VPRLAACYHSRPVHNLMRAFIRNLSDGAELALVCVVAFGLHITTSLIALLRGQQRFDFTTGRTIGGIATEVITLLAVYAILRIRGWDFARLGLRFTWGGAGSGLALFIAFMLLYYVLALAVVTTFGITLPGLKLVHRAPLPLTLAFLVLNSLFEEVTVVGYVVNALEKQGPALAITASTLLRFSYHLYQGPIASLSILPLGLLFGLVYWRSKSLWPLMVAHTLINLMSVLGAYRAGG
jgi:membrane protease YdiL (CAAX protease family)